MTMKNIIVLSFILVLLLTGSKSLLSQTEEPAKRFFVGKTAQGVNAESIKPNKIDAALYFTAQATFGKYQYIPFHVLDSVFSASMKQNDTLTSLSLGRKLQSDFFVYILVNKLENMLRVDIETVNVNDTNQRSYGVGYAPIRFRKLTNQEQLTDPALLNAVMRAFAVAVSDSLLFVINDTISVKPVPTLVIGGIGYRNNEELPQWEIFLQKEISSYDAIENLFDEIKNTENFALFDIQTRDSLYALFNLMFVENHRPSTNTELKALQSMDVHFFITGSLQRIDEGAILDLYFCRILNDGKLEILEKESGLLQKDTTEDYKLLLRKTISSIMSRASKYN